MSIPWYWANSKTMNSLMRKLVVAEAVYLKFCQDQPFIHQYLGMFFILHTIHHKKQKGSQNSIQIQINQNFIQQFTCLKTKQHQKFNKKTLTKRFPFHIMINPFNFYSMSSPIFIKVQGKIINQVTVDNQSNNGIQKLVYAYLQLLSSSMYYRQEETKKQRAQNSPRSGAGQFPSTFFFSSFMKVVYF